MAKDFCSLEDMIRALCRGSRVHICVHDVAGALYAPALRLSPAYRIHATRFCDLAKDTPRGFSLCMRCKTRANHRALTGESFAGYCPFGLYELARPVLVAGEVACILYIGNLMPSLSQARRRLEATAALTGTDAAALDAELGRAQAVEDFSPYERIADALDSYIRLLLSQTDWKKGRGPQAGCRRKAREAAEYIAANYNRDLSLRQLAALYFVNEKYLGRVFELEMGMTMRQYLAQVRLTHAARMLAEGEQSAANVALDCGFQNIPYFNRLFAARYGMPPLAYRRAHREAAPPST